MSTFQLLDAKLVGTALDQVAHVQGAYQAVSILTQLLDTVAESDSFASEVKSAEATVGNSYQTPDGAAHSVLKAAKTASNSSPDVAEPLRELTQLVLLRLGSAEGSRMLNLLLVAAGSDPTLAGVAVQIGILLLRSEKGSQIVSRVLKQPRQMTRALADNVPGKQALSELSQTVQQSSQDVIKKTSEVVGQTASAAKTVATTPFNSFLNLLETSADEKADPPSNQGSGQTSVQDPKPSND